MRPSNLTVGAVVNSPNQHVIPVTRRHDRTDHLEWETLWDDLAELQQPGRTDRYSMGFDEALGESIERRFKDGRGHIDEMAFSVLLWIRCRQCTCRSNVTIPRRR